MTEFHRIAVLGPGLLGGSVALAVRKRHPDTSIRLWGRNAERVAEIEAAGFENATSDLGRAVEGAELIVLAVPVGAMEGLGRQLLAQGLPQGAFVTDVGSVKVHPHETVGALMTDAELRFIGSHPMAGSERTGFDAADPDLFEGAPCILTNEHSCSDDEVNRLVGFWAGLGAQSVVMSAREHDRLVARISHLPHVVAVVCALVSLEREDDGRLAGGGLRDTSRVAAGDPLMWTEILMENRRELLAPLRECAGMLNEIAGLLEEEKEKPLAAVLEDAQRRRQQLRSTA